MKVSYVPLGYWIVCREITSQYPRLAPVLALWLSRWNKEGRGFEPHPGQSFSVNVWAQNFLYN